jgi:hypothetical protein
VFGDRIDQGEFEAQTWHQHIRLIPGLAFRCDGTVTRKFGTKAFANQPYLCGTDAVERRQQDQQNAACRCRDQKRAEIPDCHKW